MNRVTAEEVIKYKEKLVMEDEESFNNLCEALIEQQLIWLEEVMSMDTEHINKLLENYEYGETVYHRANKLLKEDR